MRLFAACSISSRSRLSGRSRERVYLSLGGNLGDPSTAMGTALRLLDADATTDVIAVSSLYRTPPWGKRDQPEFLNACAELSTGRSPRSLLERCLALEQKLERVREERWGPRLIDIDILLFGNRAIHLPGLDVPHARMLERAFVLVPLLEIAPTLYVGGRSVTAHLEGVDCGGIERLPSGGDWWMTGAS